MFFYQNESIMPNHLPILFVRVFQVTDTDAIRSEISFKSEYLNVGYNIFVIFIFLDPKFT